MYNLHIIPVIVDIISSALMIVTETNWMYKPIVIEYILEGFLENMSAGIWMGK